jgi:hypothetical protein
VTDAEKDEPRLRIFTVWGTARLVTEVLAVDAEEAAAIALAEGAWQPVDNDEAVPTLASDISGVAEKT